MKKKILYPFLIVIIVGIAIYLSLKPNQVSNDIIIKPKYGDFSISVAITGELRSMNSIVVRGPERMRMVGIWQTKITRMIDEGTIVKTGDFVADLDKSEVMKMVKDSQLNLQKIESQLTSAKLDSSLTLTNARDELENIKFSLEEKKITLEQSKYEAPSIIRQTELDYEKTQRSYEQSKKNYQTKVKQAIAKLNEINADYQKELQNLELYTSTMNEFTILAPAQGMLIYAKEWDGRRKVVGSQIDAWNPVVATLPDLTNMESVTYVNETDIQKIKEKQFVKIGLDANPNKKLTGYVKKVANIGEQKKNSDSKVFEVIITVNEKDTTLLPSMTTSNEILVSSIPKSLFIPLEALHNEDKDGKRKYFIYKKVNGSPIKQYIEIGQMNENEVIIKKGLNKNDEIYLSNPESIDIKSNNSSKV
ncbi:MAG TPA: HlyD family efflux transporter periplasmic adaptor subunit [Candidatus Kapabacteria bacterium]|nr:HlyD family efflux transporter periplasmic adaptor subunit [Candidatus Kapabacteria bacterium]